MSDTCVVDVVGNLRPPRAYLLRVQNETCIFPRSCWSLREPAQRAPLWGCTTPEKFHACGPSRRMLIAIAGVIERGGEVPRRPSLLAGADGSWPEWCTVVYAKNDVAGDVKAFLRAANQGEAFA